MQGEDDRHFERAAVIAAVRRIRDGLAAACARVDRDPSAVRVVAAAKTLPPEPVRWVVEAGVADVGHNYVKELAAMRPHVDGARWHFIGALQTNTANKIADLSDVVQTLASERAARRLAGRAARAGRSIDALVEVDFTGRRTGLAPDRVRDFADLVAALEGVRLIGLMTLPPMPERAEEARPWFRRLRALGEDLRRDHPQAGELSMGMSLDYEVAAEEGATIVRIGTGLFGDRLPRR